MLNPNLINFETYREDYQELFESKENYEIFVRALTERNFRFFPSVVNPKMKKRGFKANHIDHIYSISEGFKNSINPFHIAHPCNLEMIPAKKNVKKGKACGHDYSTLFEKINNFGEV